MMATKKLNVGLIGYRFMGKAHSNAYRQVARFFPELEAQPVLKAICGRNEAEVAEAAQILGWETYETDWRRLIDRGDIDIVDIAAPGNLHAQIAIAAARAGKHVLCEKPLACSATQAREMLEAVEQAQVKHGIFFNYRKAPAIALAKKMIDEEAIGKIYHWRGSYLQDWIADPNFPLVWKLRKEIAGSGALGDLASHQIDLARYLVGEIAEVTGLMTTFVKQRPDPQTDPPRMAEVKVDDATAFLARFASGATGTFEASRFALGRKNCNRFEINGSKGSLAFDLENMNELEIYTEDTLPGTHGFRTVNVTSGADPYTAHFWPHAHIIGYEHTFINVVYDAFHSIAMGATPSPSFVDGYRCNVILDAVEKSAATGQWQQIKY